MFIAYSLSSNIHLTNRASHARRYGTYCTYLCTVNIQWILQGGGNLILPDSIQPCACSNKTVYSYYQIRNADCIVAIPSYTLFWNISLAISYHRYTPWLVLYDCSFSWVTLCLFLAWFARTKSYNVNILG